MKKWWLPIIIGAASAGCQHAPTQSGASSPQLNSTPLAQTLVSKPQTAITKLFGLPNDRSTLLPDIEQWRYQRNDGQNGTSCEVIITFRNQVVEATVVKISRPHLAGYLASPCKYFESKTG